MEYDNLKHGIMLYIHYSDHSGRDRSSQIYIHGIEKDHPTMKLEDFEILSK